MNQTSQVSTDVRLQAEQEVAREDFRQQVEAEKARIRERRAMSQWRRIKHRIANYLLK